MSALPDTSRVAPAVEPTGVGTLTRGGFEPLLVAVLSPAFGYALRLTRNRADAEDVVQDAALAAFKAAHTFEPGTNFKAWFFQILTRCFYQRYRRAQRRPTTLDLEDAPDLHLYSRSVASGLPWDGDDPAGQLIDRLGSERVASAIDQLPEEYGVTCALYFTEDFAYHEIAAVLGVPVGTVRSRLHRGRKMLQKVLWQVALEAGIVGDLARARGGAAMTHSHLSRFTCEEAFRRLDDLLDRELSAAAMTLVHEHLEICEGCAREFRFEASVIAGVRAKMAQLPVELPPGFQARVLAALEDAR